MNKISIEMNTDAIRKMNTSKFDVAEMQAIDDILSNLVAEQLDHFKNINDFTAEELSMMSMVDVANATIEIEKLVSEKR